MCTLVALKVLAKWVRLVVKKKKKERKKNMISEMIFNLEGIEVYHMKINLNSILEK